MKGSMDKFFSKHVWKLAPLSLLIAVSDYLYKLDGLSSVVQFLVIGGIWAVFLVVIWMIDEPLWRLMWVVWLRSRQRRHI